MSQWKIGMPVIVFGARGTPLKRTIVAKLSDRVVTLTDGSKWSTTGYRWGSSCCAWEKSRIEPMNEENHRLLSLEIERADRRSMMMNITQRLDSLDTFRMRQIHKEVCG